MLAPFIIEQIRQREERRDEQAAPQPIIEMPQDLPRESTHPQVEEEQVERGVVVIDLLAD